jgi:hypothetical protein
MLLDNNTWPDQLYRLADLLYWEPHRLNMQKRRKGSMAEFAQAMNKLRTLEVPLNLLFNMTLRLSPQRIKRQLLNCFVPAADVSFGQQIEYVSIYDHLNSTDIEFIQPDTVLESEQARICLELKIDAVLTLDQAYKYLALLGHWARQSNASKTPYLFFLTKKALAAQWDSKERTRIFTEPDDLVSLANHVGIAASPQTFNWNPSGVPFVDAINQVKGHVRLGWASWQMVGDSLQAELTSLDLESPSERDEMLANLLGDFLAELSRRRLWHAKA